MALNFREYVANKRKLKKVSASDKRKIEKNIDNVIEEVERRKKEGPRANIQRTWSLENLIRNMERRLSFMEQRQKGGPQRNINNQHPFHSNRIKYLEEDLKTAKAIAKLNLSPQEAQIRWMGTRREQMMKRRKEGMKFRKKR